MCSRAGRCDKAHAPTSWCHGARLGLIDPVVSDYRLSGPLAARLLGFLVTGLGVAVLLGALLVATLDVSGAVLDVLVVVAVLAVVAAAVLLLRAPAVVLLDDQGYRVRMVRGVGVAQARWTDVEDVVATTVAGERCVLVRLKDGRTTSIPVRVLAADGDAFADDLREHLNAGHGYRRLT